MKNIFRISGVILFVLSIFLIHSCKKDKPTPPIITTTAVTEISYITATSGGNVTNEGGAPVIVRGVCWNTSADPTIANSKTIESIGSGTFTSNLTQLTPNTMYYVRAYATNLSGTGYGNQVTFTTSTIATATLTTTAITSITQTGAVSGGNIISENGGSVTARGVCWSTTTGPTIADSKTIDGSGTGVFTSSITGLTASTTYYLRAYATNSIGTTYGNEISFATITVPTLTTTVVSSITQTTAISGGNIISDGGGTVTSCGVCWSTSINPTITNSRTTDGTGTGVFTSLITGLILNTTYFIRAYATNNAGTTYGNEISFSTQSNIIFNPNLNYGTVTDFDGNVYKTIIIGTQTWMAENLKTTKYNDGTAITNVTDNTTWMTLTTPSYCWYNNDAAANKVIYGALYNWYTINTGKLCPLGWHIPGEIDWNTLILNLDVNANAGPSNGGGDPQSRTAGGKLKEIGRVHWVLENSIEDATNESGFTALPGGHRLIELGGLLWTSYFIEIGRNGFWWSSTEANQGTAWCRSMVYYDNLVQVYYQNNTFVSAGSLKSEGYSVRCVKD